MVSCYVFGTKAAHAFMLTRVLPPVGLPIFIMGCCCALTTLRDRACVEAKGSQDIQDQRKPWLHPVDRLLGGMLVTCWISMAVRLCGMPSMSNLMLPVVDLTTPVIFYNLVSALCTDGHEHSKVDALLRSRALQFSGSISMGIYMSHWPVMVVLSNIAFSLDEFDQYRAPVMPPWGVAVAVPATFLLSWSLTTSMGFIFGPSRRNEEGEIASAKEKPEDVPQGAVVETHRV